MKPTNSLVLEIQRLATDRGNDISDLLRKCLMVAAKLKLNEFRTWVDSELNGYTKVPFRNTETRGPRYI